MSGLVPGLLPGLLPVPVFLPLIAAALAALLPARARAWLGLATVACTAVVVTAITAGVAGLPGRGSGEDALSLALAGWEAPVGIVLRADALSAVLLLLTSVVGLVVSVHALAAGRDADALPSMSSLYGGPAFWPLWLALFAALNGVYVTGDLFNAYVMLELLTLAAVSLVALGGRAGNGAAAAALRYLFVAVVGSLLFLMAVALVYAEAGTLDLPLAAERIGPGPLLHVALALALVGLAAKFALFPLHSWLPVAHPAAPAAVSALLSGLVIKAALFLLWRLWGILGPVAEPVVLQGLGLAAGAAGSIAVLWGSFMALRRRRLKPIIAYSTVAQVGYLVLLLPLTAGPVGADAFGAGEGSGPGWTGGVVLVLAHGLAKAGMFLAAGNLALAYRGDRLRGLGGAVTHMPLTVATIGLAGVSLAGLPPSLGFAAKWQLLTSALAGGQWWWVPVLLLGGLLTVAYTALMVRATFNQPGGPDAEPPARRLPRTLVLGPFVLAAGSVLLGVAPAGLLEFLGSGTGDVTAGAGDAPGAAGDVPPSGAAGGDGS
ncbi:complex I subunit 5 family protein [Sediminivirga luteola]|uniref:complex I subunit 5 family protein n=1 Tax=Sediminivirga luteola TaxID=1774748 RepID=UPI001666B279|nr:proton-conducting transporter membrane subunit [Sediminivirga luteola]